MSCSGSWEYEVFRLPLRLATGGSWLSCSFCSLVCLREKSLIMFQRQKIFHFHTVQWNLAYGQLVLSCEGDLTCFSGSRSGVLGQPIAQGVQIQSFATLTKPETKREKVHTTGAVFLSIKWRSRLKHFFFCFTVMDDPCTNQILSFHPQLYNTWVIILYHVILLNLSNILTVITLQ